MTRLRNTTRRTLLAASLAGPAVLAAPAVARAATLKWRMATSWPRNLPGPGVSAARIARRIWALSGGRLEVSVAGAGEIVPAFEVLGAVGAGTVEMGHAASFFWQGRMPAAAFFTTVPFGLTPGEHAAFLDGEGQALWDELYRPFGVKPYAGGNTGVSMGGWFRKPVRTRDDLVGLRIRTLGLGGEVLRRLGATPVSMPPGEIFGALQAGTIDAAEFVGPGTDIALGLHRVAPFYHGPGFNKPNGSSEALVNLAALAGLPPDLAEIVKTACEAEAAQGLAEMERANAVALEALVSRERVELVSFPTDIITAAQKAAAEILADIAKGSDIAGRISAAYGRHLTGAGRWARASLVPILANRG